MDPTVATFTCGAVMLAAGQTWAPHDEIWMAISAGVCTAAAAPLLYRIVRLFGRWGVAVLRWLATRAGNVLLRIVVCSGEIHADAATVRRKWATLAAFGRNGSVTVPTVGGELVVRRQANEEKQTLAAIVIAVVARAGELNHPRGSSFYQAMRETPGGWPARAVTVDTLYTKGPDKFTTLNWTRTFLGELKVSCGSNWHTLVEGGTYPLDVLAQKETPPLTSSKRSELLVAALAKRKAVTLDQEASKSD